MARNPQRKQLTRETCTPDQLRCWNAVSRLVGGDHHLGGPVYECGYGIQVSYLGDVATYDGDVMTRMVLIAHAEAVRFSLGNGGPHRLKLEAHPREHGHDSWAKRHPTLDDLAKEIDRMRAMYRQ
jgi:hypothetical protein